MVQKARARPTWDFWTKLRELVDSNYTHSLVTIFLKEANFVDTARLMREIRSYERENLAGRALALEFVTSGAGRGSSRWVLGSRSGSILVRH